jgi:hypothetical protein
MLVYLVAGEKPSKCLTEKVYLLTIYDRLWPSKLTLEL